MHIANSFKNQDKVPNKDIRPFGEYVWNKQEALLKRAMAADGHV